VRHPGETVQTQAQRSTGARQNERLELRAQSALMTAACKALLICSALGRAIGNRLGYQLGYRWVSGWVTDWVSLCGSLRPAVPDDRARQTTCTSGVKPGQ
jgi:hypothetical protein